MVIIGAIAGVTLAGITTGLKNRNNLDNGRDRDYAADAAIEYAIAAVRIEPGSGPALLELRATWNTYSGPHEILLLVQHRQSHNAGRLRQRADADV